MFSSHLYPQNAFFKKHVGLSCLSHPNTVKSQIGPHLLSFNKTLWYKPIPTDHICPQLLEPLECLLEPSSDDRIGIHNCRQCTLFQNVLFQGYVELGTRVVHIQVLHLVDSQVSQGILLLLLIRIVSSDG
jgi:hypothetical protein